jgi:hypothetical protein
VVLPVTHILIYFNCAPARRTAVHSHGSVRKIRPGTVVPSAKLHDVDSLAACAKKRATELSGKPARLNFNFAR